MSVSSQKKKKKKEGGGVHRGQEVEREGRGKGLALHFTFLGKANS